MQPTIEYLNIICISIKCKISKYHLYFYTYMQHRCALLQIRFAAACTEVSLFTAAIPLVPQH